LDISGRLTNLLGPVKKPRIHAKIAAAHICLAKFVKKGSGATEPQIVNGE
jgi:hypothetical protein